MIRKGEDNFYLVSEKDLVIALQYAYRNHDEKIIKKLNLLFINIDDTVTIDQTNYHKINDLKLLDYLLEKVKIPNYETYIDHNVLKEGYIISKYEKNHEMNKKIYNYLTRYLNNEIDGIQNKVLTSEIVNDKKVLKYLKKYNNLDDFITKKVNEKVSLELNDDKNIQKKKIA